jgi:FlaA1/EpsC-like NDP-sugar epimerase
MRVEQYYAGLRVVVTGGAGTVGSALVRALLQRDVAEIRLLDIDESGLFSMNQEFQSDGRLHCFHCDVRDRDQVIRMLAGMDLVFHAAALKHVSICERSPFAAVQTNILGVQNLIDAALINKVERLLFTSSDKAVNPTNVMGTSKLMGERQITAANAIGEDSDMPIFASTRFGNVAGSRGSVIQLFCRQIATSNRVTLTDPAMTRFFMSLDDAVKLVLRSMELACGGEVFVTKMPVVRIVDLAETMVKILAPLYGKNPLDIEIAVIGAQPGEKIYEELTTNEELTRTLDGGDFFIVTPAFKNIYDRIRYQYPDLTATTAACVYISSEEAPMSIPELTQFLSRPGVLPDEVHQLLTASTRIA